MKKHLLLLSACVCIFLSCSKDDVEPDRDLYPQVSQALNAKWFLRQSFLTEFRYDGIGRQEYATSYLGDVYFIEFTKELWSTVPGTYKVQDRMTGLARADYATGMGMEEQWKVFARDSLQIGPNRVRIQFITTDSLALADSGSISPERGWIRTWHFNR